MPSARFASLSRLNDATSPLLLAAQVPLFYDPNLPIGARPESAFQNRSEHAEEAWREMPSVKQITSYTRFVFGSASKHQFVLWTHKRPQEIIGRMTVQEALDNHLKPGMYLAPNQAVEGEVAPACMQYELRNLHMQYQQDSSLPRSRILNIRDLESSSQVRDMLKKATLFLRRHEKVEIHIRRPEGMTTEEFLHTLKNSLHLRPDALLRALPRSSQLLIHPQASEDEVCWAYGPVLKHSVKAGRILDQGPKPQQQPSLTSVFYKRRNVQREREMEREAYWHKSKKLQIEEGTSMEEAREFGTAELQEKKMDAAGEPQPGSESDSKVELTSAVQPRSAAGLGRRKRRMPATKPNKFQRQPGQMRYSDFIRNLLRIGRFGTFRVRRRRGGVWDGWSMYRRIVKKPSAKTQTQVRARSRKRVRRRGAIPWLRSQI